MKNDLHRRISDAIEETCGGLMGDEFLAGKIVNGGRKPRLLKLRMALTMLMVLMIAAGAAFALVPRKYAVEDNGTWTYVDGQVLYQAAEAKRPEVVLEKEGIRNMAVDAATNTLFYITRAKGGGYTLESISSYGMPMTPGRHINAKYRVIQDIVMDSTTLYMLADTSTGDGEIYWIHAYSEDIPDDKISIPGWENKNTTSFAIWDDILYAYSAKTQQLAAIDLHSRTLLSEPVMAGDLTAITAGYTLDGEQYALGISDGKLVAIGVSTGKRLDTGVELPAGSAALARTSYTLHVSDSAGMLTGTYDITDLSGVELRQLYIVDGFSGSAVYKVAEAMFHEKYPDVEIVHRWTDGSLDHATEMMSGEPGIDIVCFQDFTASFSPMPQLLKSGAILDITDEPEIAALREHYLDIWGLVSTNGRQYGVMDDALPTLWQVDAELAAKIGWEIPEGVWTWEEFDALIELVLAYNETAEKPVKLIADYGIAGFAYAQFDATYLDFYAGTSNYDSEDYLRLIQREQKLLLSGLRDERSSDNIPEELDGSCLIAIRRTFPRYQMGDDTYVLPPVYDAENPVYNCWVTPLVINANTKMKEEAVYFLACFASVEATRQKAPYYEGAWLKDESLYVEVDAGTIMFEGEGANEHNAVLYNFALEHGVPNLQIIEVTRLHVRELWERLKAGEITPEEYVAIIQRQADMVLGE